MQLIVHVILLTNVTIDMTAVKVLKKTDYQDQLISKLTLMFVTAGTWISLNSVQFPREHLLRFVE